MLLPQHLKNALVMAAVEGISLLFPKEKRSSDKSHGITEWLRLERTSEITWFHPHYHRQGGHPLDHGLQLWLPPSIRNQGEDGFSERLLSGGHPKQRSQYHLEAQLHCCSYYACLCFVLGPFSGTFVRADIPQPAQGTSALCRRNGRWK